MSLLSELHEAHKQRSVRLRKYPQAFVYRRPEPKPEGVTVYLGARKMPDILRAVAETYDVSVEDIRGGARTRDLVTPRHIFCYLARELLSENFSLTAIGRFLGRDHTTVLHAVARVRKNAALREAAEAVRKRLL